MSSSPPPHHARPASSGSAKRIFLVFAAGIFACRAGDDVVLPRLVELSVINIDSVASILERGARDTVTATTLDRAGNKVSVPVAWRSSNERVAIFERGGSLLALDTGVTSIVATSLHVVSAPAPVRVVWLGPARIVAGTWTRRNAVGPNATIADSLRVVVTNIQGAPVAGAAVQFVVQEGVGSVSPAIATTGPNGIAAAQWTLGPATGINTVTASVIRADSLPNPFVSPNVVSFSLRSYLALSVEAGDAQTRQILSDLPIAPSVRLVDSLGAPRPGVAVTFTASQNGRVATPAVSTGANGVASPGTWTLGDVPGEQRLEARAEDAVVSFSATGTGTPVYYLPASVVAGGSSACGRESSGAVKCWGASPQNGSGGASAVSRPTAINGSLTTNALAGGPTHFCSLESTGKAWCWGVNALTDTSGQTLHTNAPVAVQTDTLWARISPGLGHTCALNSASQAYCWGENSDGQLGDNTRTSRFTIRAVSGGFQYSTIASGFGHTCALALDATALCWGANSFGQLGDGTTSTRTSPTAVIGQTFQSIGVGEVFTCGLSSQGAAFCWGSMNGAAPQPTPTAVGSAPSFSSLSVGGGHACALTSDGTAYCWGNNAYGQLGDSSTTFRSAPSKVAGGLHFVQIAAGYQHTCAVALDGAVACWGRNTVGELGEPPSAFRSVPRYIVRDVNP